MWERFKRNRISQSTLEYAVVIAIIVAGLIAMQTYIKRGMQGRLRGAADEIGEQFSPDSSTYNYTTTSNTASTESSNAGVSTVTITTGRQTRTGSESVGTYNVERW